MPGPTADDPPIRPENVMRQSVLSDSALMEPDIEIVKINDDMQNPEEEKKAVLENIEEEDEN